MTSEAPPSTLIYSASILESLEALETLLTADWDAERPVEALSRLDYGDEIADVDAAMDVWLSETILEARIQRLDPDDYSDTAPHEIVLVRTVGGPRCEIRRRRDSGPRISVTTMAQGEPTSTLSANLPELAFYLDETFRR